MAARIISPGRAARELLRRYPDSNAPRVQIDKVCHPKQAKLVWSLVLRQVRNVAVLAGRQSGKSHGAALAVCLLASQTSNVNLVYVTSTYASCKRMAYLPARDHNRVHSLGATPNDSEMILIFPSGSRVYFMGADSEHLIDRLRGIPNLLIVVIDEAGIYDTDKLKTMIEAVRPGLRPLAGTLCVMGTPSRSGKQGVWYEITENAHFEQHRFDYRDNDRVPSFADVERLIDEELAAMGLTRASAYFKREYLALFEVDLAEKVYQLSEINLVDGLPTWLDTFTTGGDIGVKANDALVSLGWKHSDPGHLWAMDQKAESGQDSIACADMVQAHYAARTPLGVWMDPGGLGQKTIKTVERLYPTLPVFEAQKPPIGIQVRYVNDLLQAAHGWRLYVLRGSKLALELANPTWVNGIVGGSIDEHGRHSDLVPALRYVAIATIPLLPAIPTPQEEAKTDAERHRAQIRAELAAIQRQEAAERENDWG